MNDLAYIKNYNDHTSIEEKQTSEVADSIAGLIQDLKFKKDSTDLAYIKNCDDPGNTGAKHTPEIVDSSSITKNSSYIISPDNHTKFLLIQDNEGYRLISEENLDNLTLGVPQIITELGIQLTESSGGELKFTETTAQ